MERGLWYFAHPYTSKDAEGHYVPSAERANFRICCLRAAELYHAGYNLYAPICHTHPIHNADPRFLTAHEHDLWYKLDLHFIERVVWDGLILAPGWEDSHGCRLERDTFTKLHLPILTLDEALRSAREDKAT